jgi:hypothetical protein
MLMKKGVGGRPGGGVGVGGGGVTF